MHPLLKELCKKKYLEYENNSYKISKTGSSCYPILLRNTKKTNCLISQSITRQWFKDWMKYSAILHR